MPTLSCATAQRLPCFWLSGNIFRNGSINTTNIDMRNPDYSITSLHDPINAQDAATKAYIDRALANLQNAVQSQYVNLAGLTPTSIYMFPSRGSFTVWVSGTMRNSPSATFVINRSKSDEASQAIDFGSGTATVIAPSGGIGSVPDTFVRLLLNWETVTDTSGITTTHLLLSKVCDTQGDESLYDGEFKVVYLGSDGE